MVQLFLKSGHRVALLSIAWLSLAPLTVLARSHAKGPAFSEGPELEMEGGRRLVFERSFNSERELRGKRGFWTRLKDAVAGEPVYRSLVRPYGVAVDSRGRIIVTDPGAYGIHVFDFERQKYKFLSHNESDYPMISPQCVAVDRQDHVYVTDSEAGMIFVFQADGKFLRTIGSLRGGEGIFKRPTGIVVDSERQRIYVSDTLRNKIFVLNLQGSVVQTIGQPGKGNGEFNFPTELQLDGPDLLVVDAMNFRIQVFDRSGEFRFAVGSGLYRPKGLGIDSEGHIYVADAFDQTVRVFDRDSHLLYYFGKPAGIGDFELPGGLTIDRSDRIMVIDSAHRRVQVFHYFGSAQQSRGAGQ